METVNLEPNYPNTLRWFAMALSEHSFDKNSLAPMISTIEIIRYLQQTAPEELEKVLTELRATQHRRTYGDAIYAKYCDSYDSITNLCSHTKGVATED